MLLSIIIPVHNTERYLTSCLESILSQSFADYELLLVDDGSTDDSGKICDQYAQKDTLSSPTGSSRIRVFHKENGGVSSARNLGLDEARGKYIHFVDSDDIVLQGAYQYIAEVCNSYSPDVVYFDSFTDTNEKNSLIIDDGKFFESIHRFAEHHYIKVPVWLKVIKKSYIDKLNTRFDSVMYSEDTIFTWNLLQTDGSVYNTKSKLYSYTTDSNSVVNRRDITHIKKSIDSFVEVNYRLKDFSQKFLNCPPVIYNFTHKYEVLFNRILCTPYTYRELKSLFSQCAVIGTSHLSRRREIKAYDFLYHHPLFYYIFQAIIRKVYFHRHKIEADSGDFLKGLIKK